MSRTGSGSGFTLVETIVVIVLIAVLSTMAVSSLAGSTATAELRMAARQLQLSAQAARAHAVLHAATTRLVLDPAGGRFLVEKELAEQPGQFELLREGMLKPVALPASVRLEVLDLEPDERGALSVTFHSTGAATAAVIVVEDDRRSFTLRVDDATGRVVLTEGRVPERLSERIDLDV